MTVDLGAVRARRRVGRERGGDRPAALAAVGAGRDRLLAHLEAGADAYGVTTGVGYLAAHAPGRRRPGGVPARCSSAARAPARRSRRRSCAARCSSASRASSPAPPACRAALCEFLAARLNDGWAPVVPSRGITGAGEVDRAQPPVPDARGGGRGGRGRRAGPPAEALAAAAPRRTSRGRGGDRAGQRRAARPALTAALPLAPARCSTTRRSPAR